MTKQFNVTITENLVRQNGKIVARIEIYSDATWVQATDENGLRMPYPTNTFLGRFKYRNKTTRAKKMTKFVLERVTIEEAVAGYAAGTPLGFAHTLGFQE